MSEMDLLPEGEKTQLIFSIEEEMRGFPTGSGDKVDGFVYKTTNLSQFRNIPGNRIINEDSVYVRKLAESIAKIGNVTPIIINDKWETIDGQRLIRAVRKYGLPNVITYVRKSGTDIGTVGDLNHLQLKWNYKDWLHKYVSLDRKDYIQYKEIAEKWGHLMRSRSMRGLLMNSKVDRLPLDIWENGIFQIKQEDLAKNIQFLKLLEKVDTIGEKDNIFARDRNFQKALYEIVTGTKSVDEERLLQKIRFGFGRLNVKTDDKTYKKVLGSLYNSRLRPEKQHIIYEMAG